MVEILLYSDSYRLWFNSWCLLIAIANGLWFCSPYQPPVLHVILGSEVDYHGRAELVDALWNK